MAKKYDAIVIGTGQSGPSLAARLTKEGMKTAIIERKLFGGTCVNVGCIPTKTLVASARAAYMARRAADFGVVIDGPVRVDMQRVKTRKDAVVRQSNEGVTRWLKNMPNLTVYEGHGRFETPHAVRVNGELLEADRIFINVGTRAHVPDMPGIREVPYLTNSGMMEVDFLPEHLVIIGGSYVGLEFAQMYRRFGSRVTVVEMGPRLIAREDEDVCAAIKEILEGEGVEVRLNARCMTETEVRASGRPALVGRMMMSRVGRARERSETQGFMKILVDAQSKKILGAAILGIEGDEAIHSILDVMYAGAPYTVIQRAVHIHPTVTELIPTLLGDLEPYIH